MSIMKKNKIFALIISPIGIIMLTGLIIRVILFFLFNPHLHLDEVLVADAKGYYDLALSLFNKGEFQVLNSDLGAFRTPGYSFFVYIIFLIFGINVPLVLFFQIFLNLLSVYIIYLIGEKLFNEKVGLFSSFLFGIELDQINAIYTFSTDTLFVFILLLSCMYLIKFCEEIKIKYLVLSSIFAGISALVRPINLFFPFIIASITFVYFIKEKRVPFFKTIHYVIITISVFYLSISPWIVRNYVEYGYPKLSSITGFNLLYYNSAYTKKRIEGNSINDIRKEFDTLVTKKATSAELSNPFYKSAIQSSLAFDYIKNNKSEYLKSHLLGMINIYTSMDFKSFLPRFFKIKSEITTNDNDKFSANSINMNRFSALPKEQKIFGSFYASLLILYYVTALIGLAFLIKDKKYVPLFTIVSIILYFMILTGVVGMGRYKLPISPFYIILSGYCLYTIQKRSMKHTINSV